MKEYEARVQLDYDFKIIVGSNSLHDGFLKVFRKYFYDFRTVEEHVAYIAEIVAKFGNAYDLEGYRGIILHDGYTKKYEKVPEDKLHLYINVVGNVELPDYRTDVKRAEEIK